MAEIRGTTGSDSLVGTAGDDTLIPLGSDVIGGRDTLSGGDGADLYDLLRYAVVRSHDYLIDDRGTDGAHDSIRGLGSLYQSASLGYQAWGSVLRQGDNLIIDTPSRPYRFRKPGQPAMHVEIVDHFGAGQVETAQIGGVTFQLAAGGLGTALADLMGGSNAADLFVAGAGDDWLFGNGGRDTLKAGAGDDLVRAGAGNDRVDGGTGNDRLYGEGGHDRLLGRAGDDRLHGEAGGDTLRGGTGNDWLEGGAGRDRLFGGGGSDMLAGGTGNDRLYGGAGGDVYRFDTYAGIGHDVIADRGSAPRYGDIDRIELSGLYHPGSSAAEAFARVSFARAGASMQVSVDGGSQTITVRQMFGAAHDKGFIEGLTFEAGYWTPLNFQFLSADIAPIGDDRDYPKVVNGLNSWANEVIFGGAGDDAIFGGGGTNFIWTGAGADTLIFKEVDPDLKLYTGVYGYGGGLSQHIVEDFDIAQDRLDFSEIPGVASLADLTVSAAADGDATLWWQSGSIEIADIFIELRGVAVADITADLFIFA